MKWQVILRSHGVPDHAQRFWHGFKTIPRLQTSHSQSIFGAVCYREVTDEGGICRLSAYP